MLKNLEKELADLLAAKEELEKKIASSKVAQTRLDSILSVLPDKIMDNEAAVEALSTLSAGDVKRFADLLVADIPSLVEDAKKAKPKKQAKVSEPQIEDPFTDDGGFHI